MEVDDEMLDGGGGGGDEEAFSDDEPPPPPTPAPAPKKRGRKPLGGSSAPSRAARESARRANHSRIEKARRLKINSALEALRELVPSEPGDGRVPGSAGVDDEDVDGECLYSIHPTIFKRD